MNILIIIRGLPGAGKTTIANILANNKYPVISADDYFMHDGKYIYDSTKISDAHKYSLDTVNLSMINNIPIIYVANTFTTEKELESYYKIAENYNYKVFSIIVENRHGNESIHNVPNETILKMKNRFDVQL